MPHRDKMPECADPLDGLREAGVIDEAQYDAAMRLVEDRDRERKRYGQDFHPSRRISDKLPARVVWVWGALRNIAPLIAIGLAFYAATQIVSEVDRQREGRQIAVEVLCGFGNGVANAGKNVIQGRDPSTGKPLPGVPTAPRREQARAIAAASYARAISQSVQEQISRPVEGLVITAGPRAGLLNCDKVQDVAQTRPAP